MYYTEVIGQRGGDLNEGWTSLSLSNIHSKNLKLPLVSGAKEPESEC